MVVLSKSGYLAGLQCHKLLWVKAKDKARFPKIGEFKQSIFDNGHVVGQLAKKLFPEGIELSDENFSENLKLTKENLDKKRPLFVAGFMVDELYSRADILSPNDDGSWDIYEVKSSTKVKEINLHDVSFQKYVYELAGLNIRKCFLVHINNKYIKQGELDVQGFFHISDVSHDIEPYFENIESRVLQMLSIMMGDEPNVEIGEHCSSPYSCDLEPNCWKFIKEGSVFDLYRGGSRSFDLFENGIVALKDIPDYYRLSEIQMIQRDVAIKEETYVNKEGIKNFLNKLQYPIYYLDFETINPVIPKFDGMKPYQRIPFQFSLHIQKSIGSELEHVSFLHKNRDDSRKSFMQALKDNLGEVGTILVYNQSFEIGVMRESSYAFYEFKDWFAEIQPRILDLLVPFKNFDYYNAKQKGSCSIKAVLPVFSDLNYKDLEIGNGAIANLLYEKATFSDMNDTAKKKIYDDLEVYCHQDTLAEVKIIDGLYKITENDIVN